MYIERQVAILGVLRFQANQLDSNVNMQFAVLLGSSSYSTTHGGVQWLTGVSEHAAPTLHEQRVRELYRLYLT